MDVLLLIIDAMVCVFRRGGRRESRLEAWQRIRRVRRNRAVRRWLARGERRGAIPDIGLRCKGCGYSLAGLVEQVCPECGRAFDIEEYIEDEGA